MLCPRLTLQALGFRSDVCAGTRDRHEAELQSVRDELNRTELELQRLWDRNVVASHVHEAAVLTAMEALGVPYAHPRIIQDRTDRCRDTGCACVTADAEWRSAC